MSSQSAKVTHSPPGPVIDALPYLPDHFSCSSMTCFQTCARKWFYHYVAKAPRERQAASLLFGAAIHEALAAHHNGLRALQRIHPEDLMAVFELHWITGASKAELCFSKTEPKGELFRMADALLRLVATQESDDSQVLSVEMGVRMRLQEIQVPFVGRVDLISRQDGTTWLTDAKTVRSLPSADQLTQTGAQLALYAMAVQSGTLQTKPMRAQLLLLRKLKTPRVEKAEVEIGPLQVARARRMLTDTWNLIGAAAERNSFPARPGWYCSSCPYRLRCERDTCSPAS